MFWLNGRRTTWESRLAKGDQPVTKTLACSSHWKSKGLHQLWQAHVRPPFQGTPVLVWGEWPRPGVEHQFAGSRGSYFLPFPARLAFDPAAASRRRLPILKRTAAGAGIFKVSPACRLRPRRALRS